MGDDKRAVSRRKLDSTPLLHEGNDSVTLNLAVDEEGYAGLSNRRKICLLPRILALTVTVIFLIMLLLEILIQVGRSTWPKDGDATDDEVFKRWGQAGSGTEGLAWYPTNFLQDVMPKPIHSHNDYWRKVPLFTAIHQGCIGVEADVWLFDDPASRDHLYVGHDQAALQRNRTFQSLYIQPLVQILTRQNPTTEFYNGSSRGVFDTAPNQTLTLLVDVKTNGPETWSKAVEQLEPLRERGWLTHFSDGMIHTRPITVVGTGDTPFDVLTQNTTYRDYFFDAPLEKLSGSPFDATNSYYASVSLGSTIGNPFMGSFSVNQLRKIKQQVREAHVRGLKARYWDLPEWPVRVRNAIWDTLVEEGVDMLNVDNVRDAARREW